MALVVNRSARQHSLPGDVNINPLASAEISDALARELLARPAFKALVTKGELEIRGLESEAQSPKAPELHELADGPALAVVSAEDSPAKLRKWAKKERRDSVLDAIEARLTELA